MIRFQQVEVETRINEHTHTYVPFNNLHKSVTLKIREGEARSNSHACNNSPEDFRARNHATPTHTAAEQKHTHIHTHKIYTRRKFLFLSRGYPSLSREISFRSRVS